MAKQKQHVSKGGLQAAAQAATGRPPKARRRGKRSPRRWAQKLEGRILNTNRKINHDDAGNPFPPERPAVTD